MSVSLKVGDYMQADVVTVSPDAELTRVVRLLVEEDVSGLVVIDADRAAVGVVTERDCIAKMTHSGYFDEPGGPVSDVMSTPVETVGPNDNLIDVAERLINSKYRRFPVVREGRLVGIIARRDVLRALGKSAWFGKR